MYKVVIIAHYMIILKNGFFTIQMSNFIGKIGIFGTKGLQTQYVSKGVLILNSHSSF